MATKTAESTAASEQAALARFQQFVEQKIVAAPDERTRAIRLFILGATEAALSESSSKK